MKPKWRWTTPYEIEQAKVQKTLDEWRDYYASLRKLAVQGTKKKQRPRSAWAAAKEAARAKCENSAD